MRGVNKVILIGNCGRDPEFKQIPSGGVVNFSLATSEHWTKDGQKQERTEWHNCVAFGKLAEIISEHVRKGSKVYVEGALRTRSWEKDGAKQYKTEIVVSEMQLLSGRASENDSNRDPGDDDVPF